MCGNLSENSGITPGTCTKKIARPEGTDASAPYRCRRIEAHSKRQPRRGKRGQRDPVDSHQKQDDLRWARTRDTSFMVWSLKALSVIDRNVDMICLCSTILRLSCSNLAIVVDGFINCNIIFHYFNGIAYNTTIFALFHHIYIYLLFYANHHALVYALTLWHLILPLVVFHLLSFIMTLCSYLVLILL